MNIFFILFIFYYWQQVLFTLRVSSLLSLLNDASVDIVDDEGFFSFLLKVNAQPLYVHVTLLTDTEAESPWFAQLRQC